MNNVACVILAAGKGKRMKSDLPKVLHDLHGKPLICHVLDSCKNAGIERTVLIVGFKGELVASAAEEYQTELVWQKEQLGTGHAVAQTEALLSRFSGEIIVMNGDVPLIRSETIRGLVDQHRQSGADATVLTAEVPDPTGYGRIVRDEEGMVDAIVEEADADEPTRAIREINSGMFCFHPAYLFAALRQIDNRNRQGEYYLTDVLAIMRQNNQRVAAYKVNEASEILGVNSPEQLQNLAEIPTEQNRTSN